MNDFKAIHERDLEFARDELRKRNNLTTQFNIFSQDGTVRPVIILGGLDATILAKLKQLLLEEKAHKFNFMSLGRLKQSKEEKLILATYSKTKKLTTSVTFHRSESGQVILREREDCAEFKNEALDSLQEVLW